MSDEDGAGHLGVWYAILMVASKATPRGVLVRGDGQPHIAISLARLTRLPKDLVEAAIKRLLEIGLLELAGNKPCKKSNLGSHPGAGSTQDPARKPQDGAAEGKGTEHHHHEEKRKGKEQQRTEPDGTEGARTESTTERLNAHNSVGSNLPKKSHEDAEHPEGPYASPDDELKAMYLGKAGESITTAVLDAIRLNLELRQVSMGDFVAEVRKHANNGWRNPPAFLRDLSKRFRGKTRPASAPVTAAEAEEKNYRCPLCSSRVRGEGAILDADGNPAPCSCASPEYIARQRERGVFAEEKLR